MEYQEQFEKLVINLVNQSRPEQEHDTNDIHKIIKAVDLPQIISLVMSYNTEDEDLEEEDLSEMIIEVYEADVKDQFPEIDGDKKYFYLQMVFFAVLLTKMSLEDSEEEELGTIEEE